MNRKDISDENRERAVLIGLEFGRNRRWDVEDHLSELSQLAVTAGAEVVQTVLQKLHAPNPAFYIGRGKAEELVRLREAERVDLIIFDDDLTPAQVKNLQDLIGCRVIDRTELIMDIFAQHAKSREGKIQVELAQLQYMLPRLTRAWTHLSRQEGGIGTRGPGEQQLEVDRRRIREKIDRLTEKLKDIARERATQGKQRRRKEIPVIAIVGYTNAGKSTLMNALTRAGVLVEDKLFATLDPTTRTLSLPKGRKVLFTDTVGFIRKLPHHLIESFKATLEGVASADLLIHVIDISHEQVEEQIDVSCGVLKEIGAGEKSVIAAFNKIDLLGDDSRAKRYGRHFTSYVTISALRGDGVDNLLDAIETELSKLMTLCHLSIPQANAALISRIYEEGNVVSRRYEGNNVIVEAELPPGLAHEVESYVKEIEQSSDQAVE
ncbi:MAG: GTPase HflX [Candidatus Aureabacteria bacterium]|nr:GTPase HflX [Candidatus Auribacterota bacterium]